jgi:glycosyltransferase involved in cell wall biosynthesis
MKYCVIIPTYNNEKTLDGVISEVLKLTRDIWIVNDGSTDQTARILDKYCSLNIISYSPNKGKGFALRKGFEAAKAHGFDYAITLDSDGQHFPADIPDFIKSVEENPDSLIVGDRNLASETLSQGSSFANNFSNFWFRFLTGITLTDTQTGFRLYPLNRIDGMKFFSGKYEFELEILVRSAWKCIPILSIPVKVYYPEKGNRVSHFRPFLDFARISLLYTIFVFWAIVYVKPFSLIRNLTRENIRQFVRKQILMSDDSNLKIALAITLGIFMGIVPIWGFQLVTAIALAHIFRLNKLLVIVTANISIPPMIPFLLYLSYVSGGIVLGTGTRIRFSTDLTFKAFENDLFQYIIGSIVFAIVLSIFAGLVSFVFLKLIRKERLISE